MSKLGIDDARYWSYQNNQSICLDAKIKRPSKQSLIRKINHQIINNKIDHLIEQKEKSNFIFFQENFKHQQYYKQELSSDFKLFQREEYYRWTSDQARMSAIKLAYLLLLILIGGQTIQSQDINESHNSIRIQDGNNDQQNKQNCQQNMQSQFGEQDNSQFNSILNEQPLLKGQNMLNVSMVFTKQHPNPNPADDLRVYSDYELDDQFNKSLWNRQCCSSPDLFNYQYNKNENPGIIITNVDKNNDIGVEAQITTEFTNGIKPKIFYQKSKQIKGVPVIVKKGESATFSIQVSCSNDLNYDNYWAAISINFTVNAQTPPQPNQQAGLNQENQPIGQKINVYYFFVCDQKFRPVKYAVSLNLLTLGLSVVVFFMAIYSTPLSINRINQVRPSSQQSGDTSQSTYSQITSHKKFERFEIKYYHSSIYALFIILIAVLNQYMDKNKLEKIMNIVMCIVTSFSTWFFANELLCHIKPIKRKMNFILFKTPIFNFQVMDIISLIFTALVEFLWLFFGKRWFFSDLIAIFLLGTLMKLLKFKSLKQAFMFLSICLIVDSIGALIVYLNETLSYDVIFINQYNEPFLIALPSINKLYDKYCSWLPVTGTAFPGILINYCYRYDKSYINANTKAFTYLGLFGYVFSSFIYMIIATFNIHTWPYSLINYPLMCLFLFLFAYKRSEHLYLWNGNFYDVVECGQQFVEEEGLRQSHSTEELNRTMYQGLILNSMEFRNTNEQEEKERDSGQISINNEQSEQEQ